MKKTLVLALAVLMLFSFATCKNSEPSDEIETTVSSDEKAPIKTDENLLTVEVTLSPALFEDKTAEEIKAEAKESGIKKCTINDDGSVTYIMSKAKRDELLDEMKNGFEDIYNELINGEDKITSFVDIKANDDYSQIDVFVDKSKYTIWDSMNAMTFYIIGVYYQCLSGTDFKKADVVVNFIDNDTKEILDTASYKKFLENAS